MTYLLFAIALSLSTVAEWYAIVGLMAIFASAPIPIAIMGGLLGAAKLVIASWLYRNWKDIPMLMKTYFTISLIILMFLTSMGIFGFLSKAHLDQAVPSGDVAAKLAIVDEKIKTEKENIDSNRKALKQMDEAVDQTMARTDNENGATKAASLRRSQQKERSQLALEISKSQTNVAALREQRAPIASEVRKVEAEVGPIKYIAAVIYEGTPTEDILEKAVRFVTMMIVAVFDPLAVLLLIAANWNLKRKDHKVIEPIENYQLPDPPAPIAEVTIPAPIEIHIEDTIETTEEVDLPEPAKTLVVAAKEAEDHIALTNNEMEEDLNVTIDESPKDWEPELYSRRRGRNTDEIFSGKAQSFLNKVKEASGVGVKTIELEVDELQPKP
jgi:hypothetical protein